MQVSTLLGALTVVLILLRAVWHYPEDAYDARLLIVVLGGGLGAALMAVKGSEIGPLFRMLKKALFTRTEPAQELVKRLVGYAETARRQGIFALEDPVKTERDPFMATGIRLAVDGTEPPLIQAILKTELDAIEMRHRRGHQVLKILAVSWATFGVIGTLGVLTIRPGYIGWTGLISDAAVPLLYGALLSCAAVMPVRWKLQTLSEEETLRKRVIIEGVIAIQTGKNPRIVEQQLNVFLRPALRGSHVAPPETRTPPEPPPTVLDFHNTVRDVIHRLQTALPEALPHPPKAWTLAELLEQTDLNVRRDILSVAGEPEPPPHLPDYDIETIAALTDREIQVLLREINTRDIAVALLGASSMVRERTFANMSDRVGGLIKEIMNAPHTQASSVRQVVDAQLRILRIMQLLQEKDQIRIPPNPPSSTAPPA